MKPSHLLSFLVLLFALLFVPAIYGQSVGKYVVTRSTGITFSSISATGTSMTGWRNTLSTDDNLSTAQNIGFTFYYDGVAYTQYSISTNGFLTFNTGTAATGSGSSAYGWQNTQFSASGGTVTTLAPLYDDQQTAGNAGTLADLNNSYKYLLSGSAGSRVATIEWVYNQDFSTTSTSNFAYQVKLYETDGHIEFVYGTMTLANSSTITTMSYSLGINAPTISASPTAAELLTQQTVNTTTFNNTASNSLGGATPANMPTTNSMITFTPSSGTPADPTSLTYTAVTATTTTPNWVDNSTNETYFIVTRATDAGFTSNVVTTSVSSTTTAGTGTAYTSVQTGLTPSTTYYYKIQAANEAGIPGTGISSSQTTSAAATYYWVGTATAEFNTAATWNTAADGTGSARSTASSTDVLVMDGAGTVAGASITGGTVNASVSIGVLRISSGTSVTLVASSATTRTLTITGGSGDDLDIPSGNSLILNSASNAIAIAFSTGTGMTGNIAGTLTIGGSTSNTVTTTGGTGTVVTVTSTGIVNLGTSVISLVGSVATLSFANGSNCNASGSTTTAPPVPLATWGATANLTITGLTSATAGSTNNAQSFGNIIYHYQTTKV